MLKFILHVCMRSMPKIIVLQTRIAKFKLLKPAEICEFWENNLHLLFRQCYFLNQDHST